MEDIHGLYQSNSNNKKNLPEDEKPLEKSVSKPVKIRKPSPMKRFISALFGEDDIGNIKDYILYDIIAPSISNMFVDSIVNAVQMTFRGSNRAIPSQRRGNRTYISYDGFSGGSSRLMTQTERARHDFNSIIIPDKDEALDTLVRMINRIETHNFVSVYDFYTLVGVEANYVDKSWGWYDLSTAYADRVRDGWVLRLPRTVMKRN